MIFNSITKLTNQQQYSCLNLVIFRGIKKLAYGRFLSISRFRARKGLPPAPSASGPLTDDPDWSYPDGTPGLMNKGQSLRYVRDQAMGETIIKFNKQFEAIKKARQKKSIESE